MPNNVSALTRRCTVYASSSGGSATTPPCPAEREAIARRVIALDDEIQRRLNPYLNSRYQRSAANFGADISGKDAVYDHFRREVLARLLDMEPARIGRLTSLAD